MRQADHKQQANTPDSKRFRFVNLFRQKINAIPPQVNEFQEEEEEEEEQYERGDASDIAAPHTGIIIEVQLDEEVEKDSILFRPRSISLDRNERPNSFTSRTQCPRSRRKQHLIRRACSSNGMNKYHANNFDRSFTSLP